MSGGPDILHVSLGTTHGWRLADGFLVDQLRAAGVTVESHRVPLGPMANRLRRGYPVNDFVEALAARRLMRRLLRSRQPRAALVSTTTAALLLPRLPVPYAVRFDAPAAMNRPGARNAMLHPLERRSFRRARLLLPYSDSAMSALPDLHTPAVMLPAPVVPSGPASDERQRMAVAYVPDPKAKGLEVVCAGWTAARVEGARLEVFGADPDACRRHLARKGVPEPEGVRWRGMTSVEEFRAALRSALVYVGGAHWEDFGQAPLEALADGTLVATVPSGGPFAALELARELEPRLVAPRLDGRALGDPIRTAFELDPDTVRRYRAAAAERLRAYHPDTLQRTVTERVVPALLS